MTQVVGREKELLRLGNMLSVDRSQLLAVYGRRRIGKTYLIESVFSTQMVFSISGLHNANQADQLENFASRLSSAYSPKVELRKPSSWLNAFEMMEDFLSGIRVSKKKKIVFFDEFPWMATRRSRFLAAFENFWNTYASKRKDLIVIICGSAASWMIEKVVKNRGGLHNRITDLMRLEPFTLYEVELFLKSRRINLSRYDILQLYMVTGGVPFYLLSIDRGHSVAQIIDHLCFNSEGVLHREFTELYASLFEKPERHIEVVQLLSTARKGLTRSEILAKGSMNSGGGFTRTLDELIESGFATKYLPFGNRTKQTLYRLTDYFSVFYMKFMHNSRAQGAGTWLKKSTGQSWVSWSGFTYESICIQHIEQLKKGLGIEVIYTEASSWVSKSGSAQGAQVDLLIDRADRIIHICEVKFSRAPFTIDKAYAGELRRKLETFRTETKTKKNLFLTMLTTYGVVQNEHALELVQNELDMDTLFTLV